MSKPIITCEELSNLVTFWSTVILSLDIVEIPVWVKTDIARAAHANCEFAAAHVLFTVPPPPES